MRYEGGQIRKGQIGSVGGSGGGVGAIVFIGMLLGVTGLFPRVAPAAESTPDRHEQIVAARITRILPGVVAIIVEVKAEVTVTCGPKDTFVVTPDGDKENGTGFIIHPDGWIATNGHVVMAIQKPDEDHVTEFLAAAAQAACGPGLKKLPEKQRKARMATILKDPENRKGVKLTKRLDVYLPTGEGRQGYPAVIKAYSPPIDPDLMPKDGGKPDPPMWDAALIKIEARNLPTVELAPSIRQSVALGQQLVIVGFPGVVVWHDFLSKKSRAEATVTFGRISAFRLDVERALHSPDRCAHLVGEQRRPGVQHPRPSRGAGHLHLHVARGRPGDPGVQLPHSDRLDPRPGQGSRHDAQHRQPLHARVGPGR